MRNGHGRQEEDNWLTVQFPRQGRHGHHAGHMGSTRAGQTVGGVKGRHRQELSFVSTGSHARQVSRVRNAQLKAQWALGTGTVSSCLVPPCGDADRGILPPRV